MVLKKCKTCKNVYTVHPYRKKSAKYCSMKCYGQGMDVNGKNNPSWKGGKFTRDDGYIMIYYPRGTSIYMLEHRYLMEKKLGRRLRKKEIVHHINGIKSDNRLKNLEIINNQSMHARLHNLARGRNNKGRYI